MVLSAFFVIAGVNHFVHRDFYAQIVPPFLPARTELVYLSGALEVVGGLAVVHQRLRRMAGLVLILLLVAVYPANIYMALEAERFPSWPSFLLYLRLPMQFAFIGWTYWATWPDS